MKLERNQRGGEMSVRGSIFLSAQLRCLTQFLSARSCLVRGLSFHLARTTETDWEDKASYMQK